MKLKILNCIHHPKEIKNVKKNKSKWKKNTRNCIQRTHKINKQLPFFVSFFFFCYFGFASIVLALIWWKIWIKDSLKWTWRDLSQWKTTVGITRLKFKVRCRCPWWITIDSLLVSLLSSFISDVILNFIFIFRLYVNENTLNYLYVNCKYFLFKTDHLVCIFKYNHVLSRKFRSRQL